MKINPPRKMGFFFIDGQVIENVDKICCLRNILDSNGKIEDDVSNSIGKARIF